MNKEISIKIDEDNDIYEITIKKYTKVGINSYVKFEDDEVYTLDNVYESEYGNLWDELNMAIEVC
jgi:hypothetical protein